MKSELRKQVLHEMKALPREQKQFIDQALTERLLKHPFYQEAKVIATYLSFPHEFQTQGLIEQALKDGKKVLIPKTYPCLLYTSPSPRDQRGSRMPSSA